MTFAGDASARMPRVMIANIRTGEFVEMPFVPHELSEEISVEYARQKIVGMSHSVLNYTGTDNHKFSGLEFAFIGTPVGASNPGPTATGVDRQAAALDTRLFLMSLCYPSVNAQSVRAGGPPRVLFVWPSLVSMTCVIGSLQIKHSKFDVSGKPMTFTARMDLEEIRDVRLTSEAVRASGTLRAGDPPFEVAEF